MEEQLYSATVSDTDAINDEGDRVTYRVIVTKETNGFAVWDTSRIFEDENHGLIRWFMHEKNRAIEFAVDYARSRRPALRERQKQMLAEMAN